MKYNFSKVPLVDIEGKKLEVSDLHKTLAAAIYYGDHKDLDLVDKSMAINKGEDVELDKVEIEKVKAIVEKSGFKAFVQKALLDYIASVKEAKETKETK